MLTNSQIKDYEQLHYSEYYFHLLRHEFLDVSYVQYSMADLWVYYYYADLPLIHSENALFFLLRHYILDNTLKNSKFERVKKGTVGSNIRALIAAASTVNLYLDPLRIIYSNMSEEDVAFYKKFSNNKRILFDYRFTQYEHYPKKLVQIETVMIKELRTFTNIQNHTFNEKIEDIKKLIDQMVIIEREFFDASI